MKRAGTLEQVIRKLREAERMLSEGKTIARALQGARGEQTFHRTRNQHGGMKINVKRAERENTRLKARADQALESSGVATPPPPRKLRAERPGHVWAVDFQFARPPTHVSERWNGSTADQRALVDAHSRSVTADQTVAVLRHSSRSVAPAHIRCDNGPAMTANALIDWCAAQSTLTAHRREEGAPQQRKRPSTRAYATSC